MIAIGGGVSQIGDPLLEPARRALDAYSMPVIRESVRFVPSMPTNDERLSTAGSARITRASACCRSAIAANETDGGACEMPSSTPVSWTGKNPFGTRT